MPTEALHVKNKTEKKRFPAPISFQNTSWVGSSSIACHIKFAANRQLNDKMNRVGLSRSESSSFPSDADARGESCDW